VYEIVATLFCEPGCHGVQFGAKEDGGYYAYVSSKFANDLIVIDVDETSPDHLTVVGKILLSDPSPSVSDDKVTGNPGMGGQGVLAIPNVLQWLGAELAKQLDGIAVMRTKDTN